jgi:SAM-dependent methyltransferase
MKKMRFDTSKPIATSLEFFNAAMNREVKPPNPIGEKVGGLYLNIGAGTKEFPWAVSMQRPQWNAPDPLPYSDNVIDGIVALHFFEHLSGRDVPIVLAECARVLKSGGLINIAVPHRAGGMSVQDLDHKSFFMERTWDTLLNNEYYQTFGNEIPLYINYNLIMGDEERTLTVFTQMRKP